jgi:hypothetical protein
MTRALSFSRIVAPAIWLLIAAPANADVIHIDEAREACYRKKKGDACDAVDTGTCQQAECCPQGRTYNPFREDVPQLDPPKCDKCLKCLPTKGKIAAPKPPSDAAIEAAVDAAIDAKAEAADSALDLDAEPAPEAAPAVVAPDAAPDLATPAAQAPQPEVVAEKTRGGMCASAPWSSDAGTWSLALGALLLVGLRSRRRG